MNCGARQKVEHTLTLEIPRDDPDIITDPSVQFTASQKAIMKTLTGSVNGDIYQVVYSLKIFVKHASMTSRGEGACVTLPIRIIPLPIRIEEEK